MSEKKEDLVLAEYFGNDLSKTDLERVAVVLQSRFYKEIVEMGLKWETGVSLLNQSNEVKTLIIKLLNSYGKSTI